MWPRTRFASALSTSVSGRAAAPGRDAKGCSTSSASAATRTARLPIQLTPGEYESVRADETQFAIVPGHARPEVEDVVAQQDGWALVRKRGEAAEIAAESDPAPSPLI